MSHLPITLSLTTYGKRIYSVDKTIKSLIKQTYQANLIILWLDEDEFSISDLPEALTRLQSKLFVIRFCPNYKSYKKLIPTLELVSKGVVITFDDDIVYSKNIVEDLFTTYQDNPDSVICARARIISKNQKGLIDSYEQWHFVRNHSLISANYCLLPLGYGGVLYPVEKLISEISNVRSFTFLAPSADDLWFKCMSLLSGLPVVVLPAKSSRHFSIIEGTQENALYLTHNVDNQNGRQLNAIIAAYKELAVRFNSVDFPKIEMSSYYFQQLNLAEEFDVREMASVEAIREAAINIENKNINIAYDLMRIACKLRPNGGYIKQKITQYKKLLGK